MSLFNYTVITLLNGTVVNVCMLSGMERQTGWDHGTEQSHLADRFAAYVINSATWLRRTVPPWITAWSADRMETGDSAGSGDKEMDLKGIASENEDAPEDAGMAVCPSDGPQVELSEPNKWKWAVVFLCFYGFMSSIKPGEPFITPYLLSSEKNFTREQVSGVCCRAFLCRSFSLCVK